MNTRLPALLPVVVASLVLLGILPAAPAAAEQDAVPVKAAFSQAPDVIVIVDPVQEDGEPFAAVIGNAALLKLENLGLKIEVDSVSPSQDVDPLPRAQKAGAGAVLVCSYRLEGRQMDVVVGWYDAATRSAAASSEARGDMDLHLDGVIFGALDDLLGKVQDKVQALSARKAALPVAPADASSAAPLAPAHPSSPVPSEGPGKRQPLRLLLEGSFAPFVPTGAASAYFGVGYLPSALVSLLIPTRAGPVGIGLFSGVDYFAAVGAIDTSSNFLVPLGVDLRYEIDLGALRPFFHVAGGPALLVMITGAQGTLLGLMPFIRSGLGLSWRFGQRIGASLVADYDVYFEMPYLITGFSPSVAVEVLL